MGESEVHVRKGCSMVYSSRSSSLILPNVVLRLGVKATSMEVRLSSRYSTMMNPSGSSSMASSMIGMDTLLDAILPLLAEKNILRTIMSKSCLTLSRENNE